MSSMELFDPCIRSHSGTDYLFVLEDGERRLDRGFALTLLHSESGHTSKEDLEYRFHVVDQHLLKVAFLLTQSLIILFFPHLEDDAFIDFPISHVRVEIL